MLIEYIHASAPNETRVHDTVRARRNAAEFIQAMSGEVPTQEAYDAMTLGRMEIDQEAGRILSFKIKEE